MLVAGIFLACLAGYLLTNVLSVKFSETEKIGLSFPLGMGLQTLLMAVVNLAGIALTPATLLVNLLLSVVVLSVPLWLRRDSVKAHYKGFKRPVLADYSLVWLLFIGLIVYIEYMNFAKCIYFPTFDRDSLAGFDTIGYVIAQEHTLKGLSLFDAGYMTGIHAAGSYIVYAPMVQLSYAFVYILGATTSKLIPALMFLSLLIAFYGSMRRVVGHTGAAIATFFMMITPEMIAFSSMSATNVIHAVSASLGIIYVTLWMRGGEKRDLYAASLLLGLNMWTRTDGVVFILAALSVVFVRILQTKQWRSFGLFFGLTLFPAVLWVVFSKINGFYTESIAILHPYWDADKAGVILTYMKAHYLNTQFYGWSFIFFLLSLLLNVRNLFKKGDNLPLLVMIVAATVLYMIALYQVDYKWDSIQNVMAYSAKRFLFCFIPLVWFYGMSNRWVTYLLEKLGMYKPE
ncbi:MAG: glycosyltransferase family 39 protein [Mediterranea sp.]|jgi:hypothetical protein|nr:glycosyltransferase family 39 protein [Mediterranea sp.]